MTIETRLDIDQPVWYLHDGKIQKGIIRSFEVTKYLVYQREHYIVSLGDSRAVSKDGKELFETRKLFIKSISW